MLSYQSLMPAGAGTPRYEKPELWRWSSELARRILRRPTPTPAGDKPRIGLHFHASAIAIGMTIEGHVTTKGEPRNID